MMIPTVLERIFPALILSCAAAAFAANPQLPLAEDLSATARAAREKRAPVLIAFMQKTCPYCAVSRSEYLEPMRASPAWRDRVIILEVDVDSAMPMRDFAGKSVTHRDFAKRHAVRRVPTLIAFDDRGEPASAPIVGLMSEDFYRLYIEQAVEAGLIRQRRR